MAAPEPYGSFQAKETPAKLQQCLDPLTHGVGLGIKPKPLQQPEPLQLYSYPIVPQQELHSFTFNLSVLLDLN